MGFYIAHHDDGLFCFLMGGAKGGQLVHTGNIDNKPQGGKRK